MRYEIDMAATIERLEHNEQAANNLGIQDSPTLIADNLAYPNPSTAVVVGVAGE